MSIHFPRTHVLAAALAGVMLLPAAPQVAAQAAQRAQEAREQRAENRNSNRGSKDMFPQAERKEPSEKASARMSSRLQKMVDAYNDGENEKARAAADEIIANERANNYD